MKVTWTAVGISKALQSKTRFPITHTKRWFRPTIYQFIHYRRYVLGHHTHRTTRTKPFWVFSDTFYESFIVKERVQLRHFFLASFGLFFTTHAFFSEYLTFLTRNTGTFTIRIRDQTHTKEASTRSEARYVPRSKRVQKEVRELKKKSAKKYKK